jgi:hypothetical protein
MSLERSPCGWRGWRGEARLASKQMRKEDNLKLHVLGIMHDSRVAGRLSSSSLFAGEKK